MPVRRSLLMFFALAMLVPIAPAAAQSVPLPREAQIGPRPFYLVDKMKDGPLKEKLSACTGPFHKSDFSIGHRGAALMFPEHSKESYTAAARMGAGVIECDVTFTKDRQLVCPIRNATCTPRPTSCPCPRYQPNARKVLARPIRPRLGRPPPGAAPATSRSPNSER